MSKKIIAILLVGIMTMSLLAGCGTKSSTDTQQGSGEITDTKQENGDEEAVSDESAVLKLCLYSFGFNVSDSEQVEAALNEYIEPLIGATVDIEWISIGDWDNQISLRLTSGEQMDLLPIFGTKISTMYSKDAMYPLSDLLEQYGSGIVEAVTEDYLVTGYIDGELYSIPTVAEYAKKISFVYRQDIAEECGVDFGSVKTIQDLEPLLAIVHEKKPDMNCIIPYSAISSMIEKFDWDTLGDEYGVLMNPTESLTVENLFASDKYKELVATMHEFYEKGYVQTDAATSPDNAPDQFVTGTAFGYIGECDVTTVPSSVLNLGYQVEEVELLPAVATTSTVNTSAWFIPTTSAYPEKAMQLMNLMYSDPVVTNLIVYGIEGENYQIIDEENDVISFADGQDMNTTAYYTVLGGSVICNPQIIHLWDTDPVNKKELVAEVNSTALISKALGFSFDSSAVANELTALETVTAKYRRGLECGSLDPETELPKFLEELEAAGINKVIEEKQAQLDAWAAENGIE